MTLSKAHRETSRYPDVIPFYIIELPYITRNMREEYKRWLSEAKWDLDTAKILHENGRYNASVFYSYQVAEKAVKALLYYINEAPWGHSVRILLERYFEAIRKHKDEELMNMARELDRHYIPSRYPNAHPAGTPHEAYDSSVSKRVLQAAEKVLKFVERETLERA